MPLQDDQVPARRSSTAPGYTRCEVVKSYLGRRTGRRRMMSRSWRLSRSASTRAGDSRSISRGRRAGALLVKGGSSCPSRGVRLAAPAVEQLFQLQGGGGLAAARGAGDQDDGVLLPVGVDVLRQALKPRFVFRIRARGNAAGAAVSSRLMSFRYSMGITCFPVPKKFPAESFLAESRALYFQNELALQMGQKGRVFYAMKAYAMQKIGRSA